MQKAVVLILRQQRLSAVVPGTAPLPASPDAGQAAVHAGQENQQLECDHNRGEHKAEHVAWRSVPFIGGGTEKSVPAVQIGVQGAEEQRHIAQLGLEDRESDERYCAVVSKTGLRMKIRWVFPF